jgi:adenylyltransferase/sulfurtransferase
VNDACILSGKPLISGSAMGSEGQLTVYGHRHGTCYRCLYPRPNPIEGNKSCSDSGVLGPVPGMIGILQALEVMKLLTGTGAVMDDKLLMYDSLNCSFVAIKKPPPRHDCKMCSNHATIHSMQESKESTMSMRGPQMCGTSSTQALPESFNVSCKDYYTLQLSKTDHILLDVRVKQQFDLCSLKGAMNIELANLENKLDEIRTLAQNDLPIYCICRRGIASAEAVSILSRKIVNPVYNIKGGLNAWVKEVDPHFPTY